MRKMKKKILIRTFDSKIYHFSKSTSFKAEAKGAAARHRRAGLKARVIKTAHGYDIFIK